MDYNLKAANFLNGQNEIALNRRKCGFLEVKIAIQKQFS